MKNKKLLVLVAALALLMCVAVGGTMAWLVDTTDEVQNTFTAAGIDITLDEAAGVENGDWTMPTIPGTSKGKDPIVAVEKTTAVDIWLFVAFDETVSESTVEYTSNLNDDNGWTKIDGIEETVWYRLVSAADIKAGTTCGGCRKTGTLHYHLLDDDTVSIAKTATADANTHEIAGGTMTWTAYAIQQTALTDENDVALDADDIVAIYKMAGGNATPTTTP